MPLLAAGVLAYIAGKVLDHVVSEALAAADKSVRGRVRERLGRGPEQVALELALTRADARFSQQYPQWHDAWFDEVFLGGPAAPLLARALTRTEQVTAEQLAQAWADHLGDQTASRHVEELTPAAADFLQWWQQELGRQGVFQSALDSRALETIAAAAAHGAQAADEVVEAVGALRAELPAALAERDRAVLRSRYPDMQDFVNWPSHVLEPGARWFSGRDWVFDTLDRVATTSVSAYVRVVADAGLGRPPWRPRSLPGTTRPPSSSIAAAAGLGPSSV